MADFSCPLDCQVKLETPTELAEHCLDKNHNKEYNCRCLNCKESFKTARQWADHWTDKHCHKCGLCQQPRYLSSFFALALHCDKEHKGAAYACSCKYCQQQFKTASDWGNHFTQYHPFICPLCGKESSRLDALGKHVTEEHPEKITSLLECYMCKKVTSNLTEWFEHYSTHHNGQYSNNLNNSVRNNNGEKRDIKLELAEKYKKENEKLTDENMQLRQIIYQLGKNSTLLMEKISQDSNTKQFIKSWNSQPINQSTVAMLKSFLQEHEKRTHSLLQEDVNICIICFEQKREVACFPCGHFIYCRLCAPKEASPKCAICSREVIKFETVYFV